MASDRVRVQPRGVRGAVGPVRTAELSGQRRCSSRASAPWPGPESLSGLGVTAPSQLTALKGYGPLDGEGWEPSEPSARIWGMESGVPSAQVARSTLGADSGPLTRTSLSPRALCGPEAGGPQLLDRRPPRISEPTQSHREARPPPPLTPPSPAASAPLPSGSAGSVL